MIRHVLHETCRTQNSDIPRAGRAPGGAAGRGQPRLAANRTIRPKQTSPIRLWSLIGSRTCLSSKKTVTKWHRSDGHLLARLCFSVETAVVHCGTEFRSLIFNVPDKRASQSARREVVYVVEGQVVQGQRKSSRAVVRGQYRTFSCRPDSRAQQRQGFGAFEPRARAHQFV